MFIKRGIKTLTLTQRETLIQPLLLKNWKMLKGDGERDAIQKKFIFKDFIEAFGFMAKVSI